jgi:polar amino acid transport system substrate-binding protein
MPDSAGASCTRRSAARIPAIVAAIGVALTVALPGCIARAVAEPLPSTMPATSTLAEADALPATSTGLVELPDGRLLAPDLARIVMRGELVVAVLGVDQPPFFESRNGVLTGIDIDLAREIADKLGVTVRFDRDADTFDGVVQLLARGQADIAISKLSRTLARTEVIRFSKPYVNLKRALLLDRVKFAALLNGRSVAEVIRNYDGTIGILAGSAYADYAAENFPKATVRSYATWDALLEALRTGAVTAAYRDEFDVKCVLQADAKAALRLRIVTLQDLDDPFAIGVALSEPTLLAFVNQFLSDRAVQFDADALLKAMRH